MAKITIEIDDNLDDLVQDAIDGVKDILKDYVEENDPDSLPCISNDLDYSGAVHELVDGLVPVYTKPIEDIWYLHKQELISAYEDAGIGDNPLENDGKVAIFCYIEAKMHDWYREHGEDYFNSIKSDEIVDD